MVSPPGRSTAASRRVSRRAHASEIFQAAVAAVDPGSCVHAALDLVDGELRVTGLEPLPLDRFSSVVIIGAGKATPAMAAAVEDVLDERISSGAINTKYGHSRSLRFITTTECGHPIPDEAGIEGYRTMLDMVRDLDERSLVLCLLSGGGSALMPLPAEGISLADKRDTTRLLLECGATIEEINTVRKHLSAIKGGQLASMAHPATLVSLIMSDVIGDRLDTIASGPTYPDPTTFADCTEIAERYGIRSRLPASVVERLNAGRAGKLQETPEAGQPCFDASSQVIVGSNGAALEAAKTRAEQLGYQSLILSSTVSGITREVAGVHVAMAREVADHGHPLTKPACLITGGETTVVVQGTGKGGRNQEFALAAAIQLDGEDSITAFSGGTDGTDGPTDAAGAAADGTTVARARERGRDAAADLANNDSYTFFKSIDDLEITGPTGTNVMDLRLMLVS